LRNAIDDANIGCHCWQHIANFAFVRIDALHIDAADGGGRCARAVRETRRIRTQTVVLTQSSRIARPFGASIRYPAFDLIVAIDRRGASRLSTTSCELTSETTIAAIAILTRMTARSIDATELGSSAFAIWCSSTAHRVAGT